MNGVGSDFPSEQITISLVGRGKLGFDPCFVIIFPRALLLALNSVQLGPPFGQAPFLLAQA